MSRFTKQAKKMAMAGQAPSTNQAPSEDQWFEYNADALADVRGFSTQKFVGKELAAIDPKIPARQPRPTAAQPSPAATRLAKDARRTQVRKKKSTFAVKPSGKTIPDEYKINDKYLDSITKPTHENDIYRKYLRKLVLNARQTARKNAASGEGLKFVPIRSPRTNQLLIITATQSLAFNMNNPKHHMEVAGMAAHAQLTLNQLSGWADKYSRGLEELDNIKGVSMQVPDAAFNPSVKADVSKLIRRDSGAAPEPAPAPAAPAQRTPGTIDLPQVPQVNPI